jgi:hypothetical protein
MSVKSPVSKWNLVADVYIYNIYIYIYIYIHLPLNSTLTQDS